MSSLSSRCCTPTYLFRNNPHNGPSPSNRIFIPVAPKLRDQLSLSFLRLCRLPSRSPPHASRGPPPRQSSARPEGLGRPDHGGGRAQERQRRRAVAGRRRRQRADFNGGHRYVRTRRRHDGCRRAPQPDPRCQLTQGQAWPGVFLGVPRPVRLAFGPRLAPGISSYFFSSAYSCLQRVDPG